MPTYTLAHVSDEALLAELAALVATDRRTMAALLAHLAEVDVRELFLPAACTSMFAYCTRVLHLSEDAAFKRIRAARFARQFPQLFDAVADGRLHLTAVVLLGPHLTDGNVDDVIAAAAHRTKADIEILVARLAPQPDLPSAVTPIEPSALPLLPAEVVPEPPPAPPPVTRAKPLSPERFGLQVTISRETRDKLERAQALLRHRNPTGDLAEVIDRALDAKLDKLEKAKFGATSRPRAKKARSQDTDPGYVTNDVRRDVHARDNEQCAFVSADGVRCTELGFLEFDHVTPRALGGTSTVDKVRLLCHAHNQYEAERILGADFMREKRVKSKRERAARAVRHRRRERAARDGVQGCRNPARHGGQRAPTGIYDPGARRARACAAPAPGRLALRGETPSLRATAPHRLDRAESTASTTGSGSSSRAWGMMGP